MGNIPNIQYVQLQKLTSKGIHNNSMQILMTACSDREQEQFTTEEKNKHLRPQYQLKDVLSKGSLECETICQGKRRVWPLHKAGLHICFKSWDIFQQEQDQAASTYGFLPARFVYGFALVYIQIALHAVLIQNPHLESRNIFPSF